MSRAPYHYNGVCSTGYLAQVLGGMTASNLNHYMNRGTLRPWIKQGSFVRFVMADVRDQILNGVGFSRHITAMAEAYLPEEAPGLIAGAPQPAPAPSEFPDVRDLCRRYYATPETVYRWAGLGLLQPLEPEQRPLRFNLDACDNAIIHTHRTVEQMRALAR